ncbi:MAG: outer membrane beta-barrel protein [Anditalea sp.]
MQTIDLWNKLHIYGRKVGLTLLFSFLIFEGFAQKQWSILNKSGGDDQAFSYGFFLAGHTSSFRLKYSEAFLDPEAPSIGDVRSIMPTYSPGFDLGFLLSTRLHDQINILFTPKVGFYEYRTEVDFFSGVDDHRIDTPQLVFLTEETMVEFPVLLKYKSRRFNNTRMFFVAGINPQIRTKKQDEADEDDIVLTGKDLALEMGMGFDLYFKYFKFSPEIRFSHGLRNLYQEDATDPRIAGAISEIRKKSITIYLNFQ